MAEMTVQDYFNNATEVKFWQQDESKNILLPMVVVIFQKATIGMALYEETKRLNEIQEHSLNFKPVGETMILSFVRKQSGSHQQKMLLDYDKAEFEDWMKAVSPTDQYLLMFGHYDDGQFVFLTGQDLLHLEGYTYDASHH